MAPKRPPKHIISFEYSIISTLLAPLNINIFQLMNNEYLYSSWNLKTLLMALLEIQILNKLMFIWHFTQNLPEPKNTLLAKIFGIIQYQCFFNTRK